MKPTEPDTNNEIPGMVKFEPTLTSFFTLNIMGIDYFLVKSVEVLPKKQKRFPLFSNPKGKMIVVLHGAIAPSTAQQVSEWVKEQNKKLFFYKGRDAELFLYSKGGTIISKTIFKGLKIISVKEPSLHYGNSQVCEFVLELSFDKEELVF